MISSTPSPSISPAKSSFVITSLSSGWTAAAAGDSRCTGSVAAGTRSEADCSAWDCALGLRPRRLGSGPACGSCAVPAAAGADVSEAGATASDAAGPAAGAGCSIGSSGCSAAAGRGLCTVPSLLASRGRRPRGLRTSAAGAASPAAFPAVSGAGTFVSFAAEASVPAVASAIFSISSRFFSITFPMPSTFAISRNSARLFPFSASKSCILCQLSFVIF